MEDTNRDRNCLTFYPSVIGEEIHEWQKKVHDPKKRHTFVLIPHSWIIIPMQLTWMANSVRARSWYLETVNRSAKLINWRSRCEIVNFSAETPAQKRSRLWLVLLGWGRLQTDLVDTNLHLHIRTISTNIITELEVKSQDKNYGTYAFIVAFEEA